MDEYTRLGLDLPLQDDHREMWPRVKFKIEVDIEIIQ